MKKLLTATTALALVGGAAFAAELSLSGDAELGIDYNSDPTGGMSKHMFVHEVGIDFTGSATTDGGLSFGASVGFDSKDTDVNEGSVSVSGAFGTVSIGDVGRASDLAGGIADVGLNGIGVDDIVEDMRETSAKQINYSNSFGQISIGFSAGNTAAVAEMDPTFWYVSTGTAAMPMMRNFVNPPSDTEYNGLFSITRTIDDTDPTQNAFSVDPAGDVADTPITGMGPKRLVTAEGDDLGKIAAVSGLDTAASAAELAAYNAYLAAYDLGKDGTVSADDMRNAQTNNGVTAVSSDTQYAFGMSFNTGGVTVGFGYDSEKTVSAGLGFSQGDMGANALYVKQDNGDTGIGVDLSYSMSASTLTLAYAKGEKDGMSMDAIGVNMSHDLGGGATLVAGIGEVDDKNKASMGLSFKF